MTRELCRDLLGQLKKRHLDPVLQQLQGEPEAKLSVDDIIGAYGRFKADYDNNEIRGAKHVIAAVFSEFHEVSYFNNTIIIIIIIKAKRLQKRFI